MDGSNTLHPNHNILLPQDLEYYLAQRRLQASLLHPHLVLLLDLISTSNLLLLLCHTHPDNSTTMSKYHISPHQRQSHIQQDSLL